MSKGKPLFEVLQAQKAERGKLNLTVPTGRDKEPAPPAQDPAEAEAERISYRAPEPEAQPTPPAEREPVAPRKPAPRPATPVAASDSIDQEDWDAPTQEDGDGPDPRQMIGWLMAPVGWRVPRGALAAGAAVLVLAIGGSFLAGQRLGEQTAIAEQQEYHAAQASLAELQQQPARGLVPPALSDPAETQHVNAGYAQGDGDDGDDPRIEGLNYFRLITVPTTAGEEIFRIVDFLRDHAVDAAVVPINNGRSLKLVALPGFERPRSDPRALELRERLKVLGRKWRTEYRGSTDWRDLMAERYRPGVN